MEKKEVMTREEIHDFGVQLVYEEMTREGYEILGANPSLATIVRPRPAVARTMPTAHGISKTRLWLDRNGRSMKSYITHVRSTAPSTSSTLVAASSLVGATIL